MLRARLCATPSHLGRDLDVGLIEYSGDEAAIVAVRGAQDEQVVLLAAVDVVDHDVVRQRHHRGVL